MTYCVKTGKIRHKTAEQARRGCTNHAARPYRCDYCSDWHATRINTEIKTKKKWRKIAFGEA